MYRSMDIKSLAVAISALVLSTSVNAAFITVDSITNSTIVDFSTQATIDDVAGPIQIGNLVGQDITVSGDPNAGLYTNYYNWGLIDNGNWSNGMTYVSADYARPGSLIFAFNDSPVSSVGGFMNYAPAQGYDLVISALDSFKNVLESYNVTTLADIVTPDATNAGGFRGIVRETNDISYFEVSGYLPVLDDLTFSVTAVPIPAAVWLFGSGLLGLIAVARRKECSSCPPRA